MMDEWLSEKLNKKVAIQKKDGFTKFGILMEFDTNFVKIQMFNGRTELIARDAIATIGDYKEG